MSRAVRLVVCVVATFGVGAGAAGIAAAAGAFVPTPPPPHLPPLATGRATPQPGAFPIGNARGLTLPTDGYSAPNEVVRYHGVGQDGATFTVVSASTHPYSGCLKLVVTDPPTTRDRSISGGCHAAGDVERPLPSTSTSERDYGTTYTPWRRSGSRTTFVWFGQVARDAAYVAVSVATRWSSPRTRVASVRTSHGWFALAFSVTSRQIYTFDEYAADGRRVGSAGGSSPLGPKLPSSATRSSASS